MILKYLPLIFLVAISCEKENETHSFKTGQVDGDKITHTYMYDMKSIDLKGFENDTTTRDTLRLNLAYNSGVSDIELIVVRQFVSGVQDLNQTIIIHINDEIELLASESSIYDYYVHSYGAGHNIEMEDNWASGSSFFLTNMQSSYITNPRLDTPYLVFRYKKKYLGWLRFSMELPYRSYTLTGLSIEEYCLKEI